MLAAAAIVAGCGDDDDEGDGAGAPETTTTEPAQTTTPPTREEDEPAAGPAPSRADLESCLADADLELKPGDEPFTDEKGQRRTRRPLDDAEAAYAGYVQWPSDRIADVYVAEDEAAAQKIEAEASGFVKAFGFDPAEYVRRTGAVVLTFDDPPPSDEEAKDVEDCAAG
jgi:hypothetical protein